MSWVPRAAENSGKRASAAGRVLTGGRPCRLWMATLLPPAGLHARRGGRPEPPHPGKPATPGEPGSPTATDRTPAFLV